MSSLGASYAQIHELRKGCEAKLRESKKNKADDCVIKEEQEEVKEKEDKGSFFKAKQVHPTSSN